MSADFGARHRAPEQTHWIPLADLMTGLMMVFLLIAITYMVKVEAASQHIREIAVLYERMKVELYNDLKKEFEQDLPRWGAELDRDSTIRFKEPDVLFPIGSSELKNNFKIILDDFFPRYVRILDLERYHDAVQEIRIEGHTSSIWQNVPPDQAGILPKHEAFSGPNAKRLAIRARVTRHPRRPCVATRPHYRKRAVFVENHQETRRFRGLRTLATG